MGAFGSVIDDYIDRAFRADITEKDVLRRTGDFNDILSLEHDKAILQRSTRLGDVYMQDPAGNVQVVKRDRVGTAMQDGFKLADLGALNAARAERQEKGLYDNPLLAGVSSWVNTGLLNAPDAVARAFQSEGGAARAELGTDKQYSGDDPEVQRMVDIGRGHKPAPLGMQTGAARFGMPVPQRLNEQGAAVNPSTPTPQEVKESIDFLRGPLAGDSNEARLQGLAEQPRNFADTYLEGRRGLERQNPWASLVGDVGGMLTGPAGGLTAATGKAAGGALEGTAAIQGLRQGGRGANALAGALVRGGQGVAEAVPGAAIETAQKVALSDRPLGWEAVVSHLGNEFLLQGAAGGLLGGGLGALGGYIRGARKAANEADIIKALSKGDDPQVQAARDALAGAEEAKRAASENRLATIRAEAEERVSRVKLGLDANLSPAGADEATTLAAEIQNGLQSLMPRPVRGQREAIRAAGIPEDKIAEAEEVLTDFRNHNFGSYPYMAPELIDDGAYQAEVKARLRALGAKDGTIAALMNADRKDMTVEALAAMNKGTSDAPLSPDFKRQVRVNAEDANEGTLPRSEVIFRAARHEMAANQGQAADIFEDAGKVNERVANRGAEAPVDALGATSRREHRPVDRGPARSPGVTVVPENPLANLPEMPLPARNATAEDLIEWGLRKHTPAATGMDDFLQRSLDAASDISKRKFEAAGEAAAQIRSQVQRIVYAQAKLDSVTQVTRTADEGMLAAGKGEIQDIYRAAGSSVADSTGAGRIGEARIPGAPDDTVAQAAQNLARVKGERGEVLAEGLRAERDAAAAIPKEPGMIRKGLGKVADVLSGDYFGALGPASKTIGQQVARLAGWKGATMLAAPIIGAMGGGVPGFIAAHVIGRLGANFVEKKLGPVIEKFYADTATRASKALRLNADTLGRRLKTVARREASPEDVVDTAKKRMDEITKLAADSDALRRQVFNAVAEIRLVDPKLGQEVEDHYVQRVEHLAEKRPKNPDAGSPFILQSKWKASDAMSSAWMRHYNASLDPQVLMTELENGRVWPETVETVGALYPRYLETVKGMVTQELLSLKSSIPYAKRIALEQVFGLQLEPTMNPAFVQSINQFFAQPDEEQETGGKGGYQVPRSKMNPKSLSSPTAASNYGG